MKEASRWKRAGGWVDLRGRREGGLAFLLMRLTGIGLVIYLFIHLYVLRLLAQGPEAWDAFIAMAKSPLFLALDGLLILGILYHALNGVRVTLLGLGIGVPHQARLFWGVMTLTLLMTAVAVYAIFAITG
ncbi:succinate dehydrogenase, cytochrome b556 subunit [Thermoflexus sp.]|uniref:succinate dehydrogenase, cytochrome b556 subunit n=1 Tax=Thermoflexus sp. TaxID=1969742 RepID=UPI0025FB9A9B|nr:succinate dehydrogenase, cytochrome b556 subunit [Thermoflexus sp.]MDW8180672.1 succinate dehydrogenase, cytochrome b556 subunit [Anaerolineae bacterium]MCS6964601.1 succinate dehydrogenase, cytochrome b556 subunit [Thermoflexus sp.]MCS7351218.1 succinate dehydrogenase, cytochrome b556 subunit [Thermoflexus sp.]MCX7690963.1 succinate dehydrogenase, cytochrome b556 subunit [Thermoflexus sp.]MDW8184121.1 succinate dehydrogenase, cytochrome b556 subunit [Anaerolineae bacterium]